MVDHDIYGFENQKILKETAFLFNQFLSIDVFDLSGQYSMRSQSDKAQS